MGEVFLTDARQGNPPLCVRGFPLEVRFDAACPLPGGPVSEEQAQHRAVLVLVRYTFIGERAVVPQGLTRASQLPIVQAREFAGEVDPARVPSLFTLAFQLGERSPLPIGPGRPEQVCDASAQRRVEAIRIRFEELAPKLRRARGFRQFRRAERRDT